MTTTAVAATPNRFEEMKATAVALVESKLFGVDTWQQALALGMISEAEGNPFVLAVRDYHVIKGKPVLKSEAMLARFQKAGGRMKILQRDDTRVAAEFSHPQAGTVVIDWDIERAKRAGLAGKENWRSWPRQMLHARTISEGVRATFPGATGGALTPEEAMDLPEPIEGVATPTKPATGVAALQAKIAELVPPPHDVQANNLPMTDKRPPLELSGDPVLAPTFAEVADAIHKSAQERDKDALLVAVDLIRSIPDDQQRAELDIEARAAWKAIKRKPDHTQAEADAYQAATRG